MKQMFFNQIESGFPLVEETNEYLNHLVNRGLRFNTVLNNFNSLKSFVRWCRGKNLSDLCGITLDQLHQYQDWFNWIPKGIKEKNRETVQQSSTIRKTMLDIRQFFIWCETTHRIFENPANNWNLGKPKPQPLADSFTEIEVEKILSYPNLKTKAGFRNRTMLEILYSTGIRRQELTLLDLSDIDFTSGILNIRFGKGGKQRLVPIGERALEWIKVYLTDIRPELETASNKALFLNTQGNRLGSAMIRETITKAKRKHKIKKWGNTHLFRHTMATLMLKNGADIRIIQEILGHTKIDTTMMYTRLDISYLKNVHQNHHPAEQSSSKSLLF
ncbi:tyrosine-type recombinase/integrase [bacterium]|nr:tyrosine-type recombinase/integrase [bacterium]